MLFATMAWMLYDSHPRVSKIPITSLSLLELLWISIHSMTLQDFMTRTNNSVSDQLRIEGMKIELCLLNQDSGLSKGPDGKNPSMSTTAHSPKWHHFIAEGQFSIFSIINQIIKNWNDLSCRPILNAFVVLCPPWDALCTTCGPSPTLDISSRT